jgi:hypothetical protein
MRGEDEHQRSIGRAAIAVAIAVVIFLVFREVVCWYWKINRVVQLLESIEANLRNRDHPG